MIRVIIAGILMIAGLFLLGVAAIGVFRFSHTLNRVHVAAKCDTLGALLVMLGLAVMSGWTMYSLKLAVVIAFLWMTGPVVSHIVARAEVKTNPELELMCDFVDMTKGETPDVSD